MNARCPARPLGDCCDPDRDRWLRRTEEALDRLAGSSGYCQPVVLDVLADLEQLRAQVRTSQTEKAQSGARATTAKTEHLIDDIGVLFFEGIARLPMVLQTAVHELGAVEVRRHQRTRAGRFGATVPYSA